MPKDFRATMAERAIGRKLLSWRNARGLSLAEACVRAGFSSAKLSTLENAVQPCTLVDIVALGYAYGVPLPEWQALALHAERAAMWRKEPPQPAPVLDPAVDIARVVFQTNALRAFTTDIVPSVFQIPDYALAVARVEDPERPSPLAHVGESWFERLQDMNELAVEVVFPEPVLSRVVGGPRVMKAQLLHLMAASELPSVSLRIIPRTAGAYPAMGSPFMLLSFPHRQHNDVVYVETFLKAEYVEDEELCLRALGRFAALKEMALPEGESLELIAEAAADL